MYSQSSPLYTYCMLKRLPKRESLFVLTLLVIVITGLLVWQMNKKDGEYKPGVNEIADRAVNQSIALYKEQKKLGLDFTLGPCLTNALMEDWVADLVHNPRLPIDDAPENQCVAYVEGGAKHFVELDLNGNVVRVK
jgi:hypothetical protein